MPLDAAKREIVARFRDRFEKSLAGDARFGPPERLDRDDEASLATRFLVGERLWVEMCVRPMIPQLRAGIVTDDRWKSEDLEQVIEDSGDSMSEFIEMGFDEAGLAWTRPPVEHYREQGKYFYFSTGFELASLEQVEQPEHFDKLRRMFEGYFVAFRPAIQKTAEAG